MSENNLKRFRPVPIYNYPEHLNPFYQDENHKRLRFFTLIRKKDGRPRSNSFSVSNLRDLWWVKFFPTQSSPTQLALLQQCENDIMQKFFSFSTQFRYLNPINNP